MSWCRYPIFFKLGVGSGTEEWKQALFLNLHGLNFYFAGSNGSHLLCFKPNTSGTKAGTCIVLQPGPAEGDEKTDLNEVVVVPKNAWFKKGKHAPHVAQRGWSVLLILQDFGLLAHKLLKLAELQHKAKISFAFRFLLSLLFFKLMPRSWVSRYSKMSCANFSTAVLLLI